MQEIRLLRGCSLADSQDLLLVIPHAPSTIILTHPTWCFFHWTSTLAYKPWERPVVDSFFRHLSTKHFKKQHFSTGILLPSWKIRLFLHLHNHQQEIPNIKFQWQFQIISWLLWRLICHQPWQEELRKLGMREVTPSFPQRSKLCLQSRRTWRIDSGSFGHTGRWPPLSFQMSQ